MLRDSEQSILIANTCAFSSLAISSANLDSLPALLYIQLIYIYPWWIGSRRKVKFGRTEIAGEDGDGVTFVGEFASDGAAELGTDADYRGDASRRG